MYRLLPFLLLLVISGCASRQSYEPEQHPFKDVNQVVKDVYRAFPEIPASHVFVTYDYLALGGKRLLYVQQVRFYVPRAVLNEQSFRQQMANRARDLFIKLGSLNPECTKVNVGQQDAFFAGIDAPMREVQLEMICG